MTIKTESEHEVLTNDGHERVEVADVEAFSRHVDEELDDTCTMFLLYRLCDKTVTKLHFFIQISCKICILILH